MTSLPRKTKSPTSKVLQPSVAVVSLNPRQVDRLRSVLCQEVKVHGRENFPTLEIPLYTFIVNVRRKLRDAGLPLNNVKLNGGAAGFVFANSDSFPYSDVDLIFSISPMEAHDFDRIRQAVFDALLEMMPGSTNRELISMETLKDVYIRKMVKVTDGDRWSLFSLHNNYGRCIELKFVDKMHRQFEFSVDSFQITLDPLLDNLSSDPDKLPIVKGESKFGDFIQALYHLGKQLIETRNPEEIRGGGLLKYCHLLTRGYTATNNCRDMEKYMCSRFFIDFPDIQAQEMKLHCYLQNHFGNEDQQKLDYLQVLYHVIKESTVCLMYHERRQTLEMVDRLRNQLIFNMNGGVYFMPFAANGGLFPAMQLQYQPVMQQFHQLRGRGRKYHYHSQQERPHSASSVTWQSKQRPASPATSTSAVISTSQDEIPIQESSSGEENGSTVPKKYIQRKTLLYLPPNSSHWIPVV